MTRSETDPSRCITAARELAADVVAPAAAAVDRESRFPHESVSALREAGLLSLLVPTDAGGGGGSIREACAITEILGGACMSTALIWAMHSQQVAIMADHASRQWAAELRQISQDGVLVASATTEPGKDGTLQLAHAALEPSPDGFELDRPSPMVSYGEEAGLHLVTMRAGPDLPLTEVRFVLLPATAAHVTGSWDAMGMRGTRSLCLTYTGKVAPRQVLAVDFRRASSVTAIPVGHLLWSAAWYGCARAALDRVVTLMRERPEERRRFASELFTTRLGQVRLSLDLVHALLQEVLETFEAKRGAEAEEADYRTADWTIAVNGLKVGSSTLCHAAVDQLLTMAGVGLGYRADSPLALERACRDLRSAALMVGNDRLLQLNAKQMLMNTETE